MADEPSKTPGIPAEHPSPQMIPLSKIHALPGMFIQKQPDKNYGGLVSSIQASGVKEPVILRLREDGEYQLERKETLIENYAPASVNTKLAAVNSFLTFCGLNGPAIEEVKNTKGPLSLRG